MAIGLNDALCQLAASLQNANQQDEEAILLIATGTLPLVADGYMHALYYDPQSGAYWIRAIGGISGQQTFWRGPASEDHPRVREVFEIMAMRHAIDPELPAAAGLRPASSLGPASVCSLHSVKLRY